MKNFPQTLRITFEVEVWADEDGYPTKVEVTGEHVEALKMATLTDLAQEGVSSQMGLQLHLYRAVYRGGRQENRAEFDVVNRAEHFGYVKPE